MKCECNPCGKEAVVWCQWGSEALPMQQANLCEDHHDDLWERLNPLLQLNKAWFRIDKVRSGDQT